MLSPQEVEKLALTLVAIPSVNGSPGEAEVVQYLAEVIRQHAAANRVDISVQLIPSPEDPLGRPVLLAHARGKGRAGVLLLGHIDTVGTEDYGPLQPIATSPTTLTERIAQGVLGEPLASLAASGDWLFGRGLLDMKAGVAAALAAFLSLAQKTQEGHVLFCATPDEEGGSAGVRALGAWLPPYLAAEGIELGAVLNTDYTTARPGDGGAFHAYAGSTGKLLPAVHVQGVPSHAAEPERGLDPSAVLAAITTEVTYSESLRDAAHGELAPPPVSLLQRDAKPFYDVQTALSASAYYNLFHLRRSPGEQMDLFLHQVRRGVAAFSERTKALGLPSLEVASFAALHERVGAFERPPVEGLDAREAARRIVAALAGQVHAGEPLVVAYFAGPLIPSVESPPWAVHALEEGIAEVGVPYLLHRFYPYISDLSFLAPSRDWEDAAFVQNFPLSVLGQGAGQAPTLRLAPLMLGPHGFGAHQIGERVHRQHAFEILPRLLRNTAIALLKNQPA